jgi:hypothetical protein
MKTVPLAHKNKHSKTVIFLVLANRTSKTEIIKNMQGVLHHRYSHDMQGNKSKIRNHNMVMYSKGKNLPRTEENLKSIGQ